MKALIAAAIMAAAFLPHPAKAALSVDAFLTEEVQSGQKQNGWFQRKPGLAIGARVGNPKGFAIVPLLHVDNDYRFQSVQPGLALVAPLGRHVELGFAEIAKSFGHGSAYVPTIVFGVHF